MATGENPDRDDHAASTGTEPTPSQGDPTRVFTADCTPTPVTGLPPAPPAVAAGSTVGKYRVEKILGRGGMGVVYLAHDPTLDRRVAVKLLPRELTGDEVHVKRFLAEARAAARLSHPHAVGVYEIGDHDGSYFIAMELVTGGCVEEQLIEKGPYSPLEATRITAEACKGLAAAHALGLVHRDIKPANLMRAADGSIKVADFGLAKATDSGAEKLTQTNTVVGTPHYMSPEQCQGGTVDARSDVYSLGATYYSLLTAYTPYKDSSGVMQVMYAHCHQPPPDPRQHNAAVPEACAAVIRRAMAKGPDDRYQTAGEMLADLEAVRSALSGQSIQLPSRSGINPVAPAAAPPAPPTTRRPRWPLAAGAAVLLLAVLAFAVWHLFPTGNTPAVPAGEPVKVGVLQSLSGTMAGNGGTVIDATLLAVDEINQAGGLLGRPIEAVVADGESDETVFAREARRLIEHDHVCTLFGCWTSASRKAVIPVVEELDHLLVYPVQYEGLEMSPNVVYIGAAPNQQILPAVDWLYNSLGKRRFFLVGSDYVFPRAAAAIVKDRLAQLKAEIVGEEYLALGTPDARAVVDKIKAADPDVILNAINGDTNVAFFRDLRAAGITSARVPTMSFSIAENTVRVLRPGDMAGDYAAWTYFMSLDTPENKDFVDRFQAKYGRQRVVSDPMESAYVGVKLWAQAVKDAGSFDVARVRRAMLNQRLDGPGGEVRVHPATQHTFRTPRIGQIRPNGQFEVIWQADAPSVPLPYPPTRTTEQWKDFLYDLYTGWGNRWSAPAR